MILLLDISVDIFELFRVVNIFELLPKLFLFLTSLFFLHFIYDIPIMKPSFNTKEEKKNDKYLKF